MEKNKILELLNAFPENRFVLDALNDLRLSDILFYYDDIPFSMDQQVDVLSKRVKSSRSKVEGLKDLLDELIDMRRKYSELKIIKMISESGLYSIYCSVDCDYLLGITFIPDVKKEQYLELEKEYIKRGLDVQKWNKE